MRRKQKIVLCTPIQNFVLENRFMVCDTLPTGGTNSSSLSEDVI